MSEYDGYFEDETESIPVRAGMDVRIIALKEARLSAGEGIVRGGPEEIVNAARIYADFLLGTNDAEVIRAARAMSETAET